MSTYDTLSELPVVPDELLDYTMTEEFKELHTNWQRLNYDGLTTDMPDTMHTEHGPVIELMPDNEVDDSQTLVLALPHQQPWQPSHYIRAEYARQVVDPNARMIVLPNNNLRGETYYDFTPEEYGRMHNGDPRPFFEQRARTLEALELKGEVMLSGYSLGGLAAAGIAACGPNFRVGAINADEAPNYARTTKELQSAFLASGGWGEQRAAIADAKLPALNEAMNVPRMAWDYTRFAGSTLLRQNKAMVEAMAGLRVSDEDSVEGFDALVAQARRHYPEAVIKLGQVAGSTIYRPSSSSTERTQEYSGVGARKHATGDNVVAHALMMRDLQS